ncbi:MAG: GAF domain-containing protein [Actinomycetota bacterium]|nr:GAF domain-containing protein [Actinomycetota bacterium]
MDGHAQRQTAGLVEAGLALASELDLDALLQRIADLAREVVGARYGAVGVVGEDGLLLRFVYSGIDKETADRIGDLPHGRGLLGVLLEDGRPMRMREISEHPDSYGFPPNHPPMHSFLGIPIIVRDRVFGRLYLTEKQGAPEFTKDDERIAMTLAAQAGVTIQNANLLEEVKARGDELADSLELAASAPVKRTYSGI